MPKERRKRTNTHDQSVRLDKRSFILDGNTEHIKIGEHTDLPATEVLSVVSVDEKPSLTKKEKQQQKHDAFMQRLETGHTPYSKSHTRRLKRKAKEEIASGFRDIALALPSVVDDPEDEKTEIPDLNAMDSDVVEKLRARPKQKVGRIGEGKGAPLSKKQRKQVLKTEKFRQPLLLATPEFSSNPFQALRIHAQNTLVKHQPS